MSAEMENITAVIHVSTHQALIAANVLKALNWKQI